MHNWPDAVLDSERASDCLGVQMAATAAMNRTRVIRSLMR
jgi:hypothetical protein